MRNVRISTIRQRKTGILRRKSKLSAASVGPSAAPSITPNFYDTSEPETIVVNCKAGLAQINISNGLINRTLSYAPTLFGQMTDSIVLDLTEFDQNMPLRLEVLGCNGRVTRIANAWKTKCRDVIRISNSSIILRKQSAIGTDTQTTADDEDADVGLKGHQWAVLLNEKGPNGKLSRATTIDLRIGCILDGAVIYYEDGHKTPCGLHYGRTGSTHYFGGGNSVRFQLPQDVDIVKVEVNRSGWGSRILGGIVMTLSNGTRAGSLNGSWSSGSKSGNKNLKVLEPGPGERIVGFYGTSSHYTEEFGIITGPKDEELPAQTYDTPELQNIQDRDWFTKGRK